MVASVLHIFFHTTKVLAKSRDSLTRETMEVREVVRAGDVCLSVASLSLWGGKIAFLDEV